MEKQKSLYEQLKEILSTEEGRREAFEFFNQDEIKDKEREEYSKTEEFQNDIISLKKKLKEHGENISFNTELDWKYLLEDGFDREEIEKVVDCILYCDSLDTQQGDDYYDISAVYNGLEISELQGQGTCVFVNLVD